MNNSKVRHSLLVGAIVVMFLLTITSQAFAHVQQGMSTSFMTGLSHPWSGLDHVLAMVAVGLWGAQLGRPALYVLPISFPLVMTFGAMLGLLGIPVPGIEVGIAFSAIVLGIMVLGEVQPKLAVATVLVGCFAIFHGHAHGTELPAEQSGQMYSIGFVLATGCLHGFGILIGLINRWPMGQFILRFCGAVITGMGAYFLWTALS